MPYFQHWGDEPRPRFFSGEQKKSEDQQKKGLHQKWNPFYPNSGEDQTKKRSSPKNEHFFPRIQVGICAQMHTRVKILGEDADVDHTQIIGGDTVKLLWGIYPPGFWHPCGQDILNSILRRWK